ncbi:putative histone h1 [Golovinomyces cichoracearum]|uniref:Histone H1 n=1 Tax=Golovinomyces cichoracearum TaxID=62708 RepID=A0A420I9Y1_9PEZI|nr:putative histone h1 [Golovinomyces cichoracearum]
MPPKIATAKPKAKPTTDHISYQDMIIDAIVTLKERNGSSRVALKKYIKANHKHVVDGKMFDSLFNRALKSGVDKGVFAQPKGASGGTKLAKKETKSLAKPAIKVAENKVIEKKPVTKKAVATKKVTARKVETSPRSKTSKAKTLPRVTKASEKLAASAARREPAVISRTKSGRVSKSSSATVAKSPSTLKSTARRTTAKKSSA